MAGGGPCGSHKVGLFESVASVGLSDLNRFRSVAATVQPEAKG
jgi:hypothetical protein